MNFLRRLFGLLQVREVWLVITVALIVALIWMGGPLLGIGETRPLESELSRYLLIALILAVCCLLLVRRMWRRANGAGLLARWREQWARPHDGQNNDVHREAVAELRSRFRDALHLLRHATERSSRLSVWIDKLTGRYAYHLPWYLVVGSAGSGKSAALVNSGLQWSLAEQAARCIVPTRQCDWWFSNRAVIIDTPGPYLEAADDALRRGAEWNELLALLDKYRPRQPINGVLVTVDIEALLALNEPDRAAYAARLRKPLQLMQAKLDMRVPVYLCFTKMDRLSGFCEYFSSLNREGRAQVWGTTFALTDAASGDNYARAFDALAQRVNEGLSDVLIAEPDLDSRALAHLFPQQFASLKEILNDFCAALFHTSRLETNLLARGIYFSSAQQDTAAIDRVLGPVRQQLDIVAEASARVRSHNSRGYFLNQLLQEALFADAGLASTSRASRRQWLIGHTAVAMLAGGLLLALVVGWTLSYLNNRAYLQEVDAHIADFNQLANRPIAAGVGAVAPLVPMLETLQSLPHSEHFDIDAPPAWRHSMGLYQGRRIRETSAAAYRRALDEKLLPQAAARLEAILATTPVNDIEYSYDALKAYLMLHDAAHYDGSFLAAWLILDTEKTLPRPSTQEDRARLEAHIANLFESRQVASPFAFNAPLVSAVRQRLARNSPAQRAYHLLRRELLRTMQGAPITVVSASGPQAALVFRRLSGMPLTDGISRLYTYRGYWETFNKRAAGAAAKLRGEDPWVLGIDDASPIGDARLTLEVKRAYFQDYIDVWDAYLNDLSLVDSGSITQSTQIARILSAPDSPLKQFLLTAANETNLSRSAANAGTDGAARTAPGRLQKHIDEAKRSLAAMFGNAASETPPPTDEKPETVVDDHFAPLRQLVGSPEDPAGNSPLDRNLHVIDELYSYLTSASAALNSGNPPPQTDVFNTLQADAGRMPPSLRKIFGDLARTGLSQVGAAARANIEQDAQGGIGRVCRHMIAGRYPFTRSSMRDVSLDDFSKLFSAGGLMDSFFRNNLASQIDVSRDRWSFRHDAAGGAPLDTRLAVSFQNADVIRTAFFPGNATAPSLQLELTPLDLDPSITQYALEIDGQTIRYAHGPQIPVSVRWPMAGGANLVSLQIATQNGNEGLQTQGPWALHRLLDKARITPGATPESFVATFDFNGRKLALRITPGNSYNPFQLPQMDAFTCPS